MNQQLVRLLSVTALVAAVVGACLLRPTTAEAQFVEGQYVGRPSCAAAVGSTDGLNCAARAATNNVLVGFLFKGGVIFRSAGGPTTVRNPSCVEGEGGAFEAICAVVGADNALYGFGFPGVDPITVRRLGGTFAGDPSCATKGNGYATCVGVDFNNVLVAVRFNPTTGEAPEFMVLGGTVVDNPSCAPARGGLDQVICAVKGTNNALFGIRFNVQTGFSSGFRSLGGNVVGSPSCANSGPGFVTCAVRDAHNALVGIRFNPTTGGRSPLQNLGGTWVGDPSCAPALRGLNTVICVGRATDNNMEAIRFNPSTGFNSGFRNLGGVYASDASCANRAEGRDTGISCVARATNDSLFGFIVSP